MQSMQGCCSDRTRSSVKLLRKFISFMPKELTIIKNCALGLLARREHSQYELRNKLKLRKFSDNLIVEVLKELTSENLQSDARFTEIYIRHRAEKGYGPLRIQAELRERGIVEESISQYLDESAEYWIEKITTVKRKKFGNKIPKDFSERAKQMRFLQYRGFTLEQIKRAV